MSSLYVSKTKEEAINWYKYFESLGRPVFQIVKLRVEGNIFVGDACNCFDGTTNKKDNIINSKIYWSGRDNNKGKPPVYEILVSGTIEVIEIIKENIYL